MPLHKYAQQAGALAQEAIALLDAAQAERVRAWLAGGPYERWLAWKTEQANVIAGFVLSTPAERKRKYQKHPDYPLIVYAAYEEYWNAQALLRLLAEHRVEPGLGYRSVAYEAAQVVQGVGALPIPPWPFRSEAAWPGYQATPEDLETLEHQREWAAVTDELYASHPLRSPDMPDPVAPAPNEPTRSR